MAPPPVITLLDRKAGTEKMLAGNGEMDLDRHVALSPDARIAAGASSKNYYLWDVESGKRLHVLPREETYASGAVAFHPDEKMIAVALSQWETQLLDAETLEPFATLRAPHVERLTVFCFSPDGRRFLAATQEGRIHVWDLREIRRQLALIGLDWKARPWFGKS
jgi:WD40 repeat protein